VGDVTVNLYGVTDPDEIAAVVGDKIMEQLRRKSGKFSPIRVRRVQPG